MRGVWLVGESGVAVGLPHVPQCAVLCCATRMCRPLQVSYDELTYNGLRLDQFVVERSAAYVSQNDIHQGELTVRETLDFSSRCQGMERRRRE